MQHNSTPTYLNNPRILLKALAFCFSRFTFHARLMLVIVLLVVILPARPMSAAPVVRDTRFGAVETFRAPDQANELGVGWSRMLFWWSQIQPVENGELSSDFIPDIWIKREIEDGRQVVGLISQTPRWANGTNVTEPPRNLDLPYNDPRNYWGAFITRLVNKYKDRVHTWVIWNEPDVWDVTHPGLAWSGSVEQFYQLQKVAYQAAKAADPNTRILLPGLTYWWDAQYQRRQYFDRLLEVAAADPTARANGWYFDAAVLQLYNDPKMLYEGPMIYRKIMEKYGIKKPIWINETNVCPWDDPHEPLERELFRGTQDEQASYIIQALAYALAADVERIALYKMRDDHVLPGNELFGLIRRNGTVRPAFYAYQTAIKYFSGVQSGKVTRSGEIMRIILEKPQERITVVWNGSHTATTAYVPASAPVAKLVDKFGNASTLTAKQGFYTLALSGATANTIPNDPTRYYIGGHPFILIEQKGAQTLEVAGPGTSSDVWIAPGTNFAVSGKWLEFYKRNGWVDNLGLPRSNVITDPLTGMTVQYFQRAILEWHPQNPDPYKIQRRLLADIMLPGADAPVSSTLLSHLPPGSWQYFPYSAPGTPPIGLGHFVSNYTVDKKPLYFLDFFNTHGGLEVFGFPKEEPKLRNGRWTQRFQAAVLEYHPENDIDGNIPGTQMPYRNFRVLLRLLGDQYMRENHMLYE